MMDNFIWDHNGPMGGALRPDLGGRVGQAKKCVCYLVPGSLWMCCVDRNHRG